MLLRQLQSIEVSKVRLVCLLHNFMNINEASKMATCDLGQRKLRRSLSTSSVTSKVLFTLASCVFLKYVGEQHVA